MDFLQLAKDRYSVRKYQDKKVTKEHLDLLLEAARVAPTAKNAQPQKIYVLQSDVAMEKINALTKCIFGAPMAFIICYDTEREWKNAIEEGIHSGDQDASIVATHIMMEAQSLGLGTCWVNLFSNSAVAREFHMPKNIVPVLLLPVGYPDVASIPNPRHFESRELEDMVEIL